MKFDWEISKEAANIIKHDGVTFEEAKEVFDDLNSLESFDAANSTDEIRFRRIGRSSKRLLFMVYSAREIDNEEVIRMISVRKANAKEIVFYNESNKRR